MSNKPKLEKPKTDLVDFAFEFDGETYKVPAPKLWPLEAGEYQEEGRIIACIKTILGEDQYKMFKKNPRTLDDLEKFSEALFDAADLSMGE